VSSKNKAERNEWIDSILTILSKSRRILIYLIVLICVVFFYLPDFGIASGYVTNLLPVAVGASFFLLLEIVLSIEQNVRSISTAEQFPSQIDAYSRLEEVLTKRSRHRREVKIMASTGDSSFRTLKRLLSECERLDIKFLILDSETPNIDDFASHWSAECQSVEKRIKRLQEDPGLKKREISIAYCKYSHTPRMKGFSIDDRYLLVGFYTWTQGKLGLELVGAENPYFFYSRENPTFEFLHSVFQNWFERDWHD